MITLVVNPRSAGGGTAGRVEAIAAAARRVFGPEATVAVTERPDHATLLAREAVSRGARIVVAVGGDGTANEVVNGLFDGDRPARPDVVFGLVPAGTGGDLARTLRQPKGDPEAAMARIRDLPRSACDVLHVTYRDPAGGTGTRLGINVVGFGLSGAVVDRVNRGSKRWGGRATFLGATVAALASWRAPVVNVSWVGPDGSAGNRELRLSTGFVANAQYCGGGMWVGRGGSMTDGAADLTLVPELPLPSAIANGVRLFTGTLENVKEVSRTRVIRLTAISDSERPVLLDIDGEQPGMLPIEIRVLERSLLIPSESRDGPDSVGTS